MADTLWPTVLTNLASTAQTAVGSSVQVFTGPPIIGDDLRTYVAVGVNLSGEAAAGSWDDRVTTLGLPARHEEYGSIVGSVVAQSGDTDAAASITAAFALYESIVDQIETDPTLGMSNLVAGRIDSGQVDPGQSRLGAFTEIQFTFTYQGVTGT